MPRSDSAPLSQHASLRPSLQAGGGHLRSLSSSSGSGLDPSPLARWSSLLGAEAGGCAPRGGLFDAAPPGVSSFDSFVGAYGADGADGGRLTWADEEGDARARGGGGERALWEP
jgi:hypothetical protein